MICAVQGALSFAIKAHKGQSRSTASGVSVPYHLHLVDVADILYRHQAPVVFGDDVLIVAYLHDVIEDTRYNALHIEALFDSCIAKHVSYLTLPPGFEKDPEKTTYQLAVMTSHAVTDLVRAVKIADKTSNVADLVRYRPPWKTTNIIGYATSAAQVVETAMRSVKCMDPTFQSMYEEFKTTYDQCLAYYNSELRENEQSR